MVVRLTKAQRKKKVTAERVYEILKSQLLLQNKTDRDREHFWTICLDSGMKIIAIDLTSIGCKGEVIVQPMEVFNFAVKKRAARIIVAHNHPSGNLKPSFGDKKITEKLCDAGKILNIPLLDHIIITKKRFYSFEHNELLEKLRNRKTYHHFYIERTYNELMELKQDIQPLLKGKKTVRK